MEPFFFNQDLKVASNLVYLDEENSKHCTLVLKMKKGQGIRITDGKGNLALGKLETIDKRRCQVKIEHWETTPPATAGFSVAVGLTKNKTRNEWIFEKMTEMGVAEIYPLITENSERIKFKEDRASKILISALLQSQQTRLPLLHPITPFEVFLKEMEQRELIKLVAHCEKDQPRNALITQLKKGENALILIGPEGDFSPNEIKTCLNSGFKPVHLGNTRLRTETAAIYACAVFNAFQNA